MLAVLTSVDTIAARSFGTIQTIVTNRCAAGSGDRQMLGCAHAQRLRRVMCAALMLIVKLDAATRHTTRSPIGLIVLEGLVVLTLSILAHSLSSLTTASCLHALWPRVHRRVIEQIGSVLRSDAA